MGILYTPEGDARGVLRKRMRQALQGFAIGSLNGRFTSGPRLIRRACTDALEMLFHLVEAVVCATSEWDGVTDTNVSMTVARNVGC